MKEKETSYVDENGKEIRSTKKGKQPKENIPGYKFVTTNKLPNGDTEHVYEKVTTVFKDKEGNVIPGTTTETGEQPKKDIPGYKFVTTNKLPNGDTEHVYEKVTTVFKDKEGNVIPGTTTETGEQPKKDIPGYKFVTTNKLPNGDTEHVYEKVTTPIPTPSVEKTKGIIRDTEGNKIPGFEFDMLSPVLDIPEYEYVETVTEKDGTVKHVYRAKQTIHRDKDGNPIPNVPAKEKGLKESRNIPGYRLVETKPLPNGDVEHVYEKETSPTPTPTPVVEKTTTWTDENGNPIKPSEKGSVEAGEVSGYEFVRTVVDENGNVRHIFRKVTVATPKAQVKRLANTGTTETNTGLAGLGLGILGGLLAAARRRKEK
ncbi:Cell-wall surface anchor repeat protein [Gemella haemolysans]|nr:Cell-wall surface anchor repeat protein [Gemella haemolysans]